MLPLLDRHRWVRWCCFRACFGRVDRETDKDTIRKVSNNSKKRNNTKDSNDRNNSKVSINSENTNENSNNNNSNVSKQQ